MRGIAVTCRQMPPEPRQEQTTEHIAMSIDYNQEMTAINAELQNQRPQIEPVTAHYYSCLLYTSPSPRD